VDPRRISRNRSKELVSDVDQPLQSFRVGDAFPADDHHAALIRLIISTRWLGVGWDLREPDIPDARRNRETMAAREVADTLRYCDEHRWFEEIDALPNAVLLVTIRT